LAHQQAYVDWIRRTWELGGLRLAVCLAVNNEFAVSRALGTERFAGDDKGSVEVQLDAMREMVGFVDQQAGGAGAGFMQIASSPHEARELVRDGRLALVPGVEVSALGGFRTPEMLDVLSGKNLDSARQHIAGYLDHIFARGIRHVFPVHLSDNAFGGAAVSGLHIDAMTLHYTGRRVEVEDGSRFGVEFRIDEARFHDMKPWAAWFAENWMAYPPLRPPDPKSWSSPGGHINRRGLTVYGRILVEELMRRGMVIDVDHMSHHTLQDVLRIAEAHRYPVVSGHTGFRDLQLRRRETSLLGRVASEVNHSPDTIDLTGE
jgi:hypothetical protein